VENLVNKYHRDTKETQVAAADAAKAEAEESIVPPAASASIEGLTPEPVQ